MKRLLLAAIAALATFSVHARIGMKEAKEIVDNIKAAAPADIDNYLFAQYNIIQLAALCKHNNSAEMLSSSTGLKNTDCLRLSRFMFDALNKITDLSPEAYKNIEDSMIEILEQLGKESSADIKHTHSISVDTKNFITQNLIPSIVEMQK